MNSISMYVPKKTETEVFLLKLGMRPNLVGFPQMVEAIRLWCECVSPECVVPQVTKVIYPVIALRHEVAPWSIERNLRYVLRVLSEDNSAARLREVLHAEPRAASGIFRVSEFLALAALALQEPYVPWFDIVA